MKVVIILTITYLLFATVELKRKRSRHKNNKTDTKNENITMNDYLRLRTEPQGTAIHLLDLDGDMRERFFYSVTTNEENVINAICSPFSAMMPLGMLMFGAGNKATEKDLKKAAGLHKKDKPHDYFKGLLNAMKHLPNVNIYLASRIYISDEKNLNNTFKEEAEATFTSSIETIDMKDGNRVANEVNEWVRTSTMGKIENILRPKDVEPETVVMLVDAIYFSASWKYKFKHSHKEVFYGVNGEIKVNMMNSKNYYMYGTSSILGAEAILIPYEEDAASMLVLLPHARNGLYALLMQLKLAPELINMMIMEQTYVQLEMPSFKIETTLDLQHLYLKVGITEIFKDGQGLHGMVENDTIFIKKGVQKAMIEVTETGTIAAAASVLTGFAMTSLQIDEIKPLVFRADHPFLFIIIAQKQQLFGGTFVG